MRHVTDGHTPSFDVALCCDRYGFIVMDGNGSLFGTLSGNARNILGKFTVELPKKHGRGGQSALRFARLRMEKRHNYVRKVRAHPASFYLCVILLLAAANLRVATLSRGVLSCAQSWVNK